MSRKYRLAVLTGNPTPYQSPLFRKMSSHPEIDLTVYYSNDWGLREDFLDPSGFNCKVKWDIPLLKGYKCKFLPNLAPKQLIGPWGQINPSVIKEICCNNFDAIWVHGYTSLTNWFGFLGAWLNRTPILFRGESHLLNNRAMWRRGLKQIVLSWLFKRISSFLPIGTLNADYYKHYRVPEKKMFLTPYCVDNDFFSMRFRELCGERNNLKRKLGIMLDAPVILFAARMMPRKRAIDLLKAYEKIQDKVNAALVFVGDGAERPTLETYTKDHNIKNVHFVGFKNQTELPYYYVIADVFVLPSIEEPWGLIINEAMNFGLPIITTDQVGSGYDLVKNEENGFIFPGGDIEKLSCCLLRLLQNPELREKMGQCSLEIIAKWGFKEDVEGLLAALEYVSKPK